VIVHGKLLAVGTGYSMNAPAVVMRPMMSTRSSVNQSAPSGPAVMLSGLKVTGYSVNAPAVVMRPIFWALNSVNHTAPSGPTVIPYGRLWEVGCTQ
jgi:hypothetical protein